MDHSDTVAFPPDMIHWTDPENSRLVGQNSTKHYSSRRNFSFPINGSTYRTSEGDWRRCYAGLEMQIPFEKVLGYPRDLFPSFLGSVESFRGTFLIKGPHQHAHCVDHRHPTWIPTSVFPKEPERMTGEPCFANQVHNIPAIPRRPQKPRCAFKRGRLHWWKWTGQLENWQNKPQRPAQILHDATKLPAVTIRGAIHGGSRGAHFPLTLGTKHHPFVTPGLNILVFLRSSYMQNPNPEENI